jgi:hypothetical protein
VPGHRQREIVLAEVKHVRVGGVSDVGAIVDRDEGAVATRCVGEYLQGLQLGSCFQRPELLLAGRPLVTQLDDVDPAR